LVTTLTKRMSEDLAEYLKELGIKVRYLHSEVETLERIAILRDLRLGEFHVLVGINLFTFFRLRELQFRSYEAGTPTVVVYEGWDAAGKGGNIRRLTELLDPRAYTVVPIAKPAPFSGLCPLGGHRLGAGRDRCSEPPPGRLF